MDFLKNINNVANDVYKQTIPANARMLAKSIFNPTPVTENNFNAKELELLRQTAQNSNGRGIDYPNYPHQKTIIPTQGDDTPVRSTLFNPSYRMATTIGKAQLNQDIQGNTHVVDNYDFGDIDPKYMAAFKALSPVYQAAEQIGNTFGHPMPVNINLGKY